MRWLSPKFMLRHPCLCQCLRFRRFTLPNNSYNSQFLQNSKLFSCSGVSIIDSSTHTHLRLSVDQTFRLNSSNSLTPPKEILSGTELGSVKNIRAGVMANLPVQTGSPQYSFILSTALTRSFFLSTFSKRPSCRLSNFTSLKQETANSRTGF